MKKDRKKISEAIYTTLSSFLPGKGRFSSWGNRLALILIFAAIISGFATYGALTEAPPFGDDPNAVIWLLNIDLIILLLLVTVIARRVVSVWAGRRRGIAGSRLHVRLVFIFSLLAAAPAIIMTLFSAFFFHFGVQSWFSDRVSTAVQESQAVAEAYLEEHMQVIRADTLAMANDLNRQYSLLMSNRETFDKIMHTQSFLRNLSETLVFDASGNVLARYGINSALAFESVSSPLILRANEGDVVVMTGENGDRVRALVKLNGFTNSYLLVGRMVDQTVLTHVADTRKAVQEYKRLEDESSGLQITITMIFVVVALLLLFAAIWFGLILARQLVTPIGALIAAADQVRGGDLTARVPAFDRRDEFDVLGHSFNRMTSQIQEQRNELITANRQLDQRRRFTETVLAGVSAGIIGVNEEGKITLANSSAGELFQCSADHLAGKNITAIIPDIAPLLAQAHRKPDKISQAEIPFSGKEETRRIFLVRIAIELMGKEDKGAVLTFDDITELQSAQRKAAWADVARRIAHEIKNPLTPIQLSAERLKRKYLKQIETDPEVFSQCTDTIIHHVEDIGRMVNEFSAFARMPEPVIREENLGSQIRDTLALQQQAHPEITFNLSNAGNPVYARFDSRQIRQAFTNIIQNAIDSIHARIEQQEQGGEKPDPGRIDISIAIRETEHDVVITVTDNGSGLPKGGDADHLTEPYVTHKEKGTGLGLAIVKKIMEDHGGRLVLGTPDWLKKMPGWHESRGARVSLILPLATAETQDAETQVIETQVTETQVTETQVTETQGKKRKA